MLPLCVLAVLQPFVSKSGSKVHGSYWLAHVPNMLQDICLPNLLHICKYVDSSFPKLVSSS